MTSPKSDGPPSGLAGLRRGGRTTELLFVFECLTEQPPRLAPIARRLGLTVQAASHTFRQLSVRGLVELRDGRYRPTVRGVDWLHRALVGLRSDLDRRLDRLHVIRRATAVAQRSIAAGATVVLEMRGGLLTVRPGRTGASTGRARAAAGAGELVEVEELEGIVPIRRGRVHLVTIAPGQLADPDLPGRLRSTVRVDEPGFLGGHGLEAYHLLRRSVAGPVVRFAVGAAAAEAARLGVDATVLLLEDDLPRLLEQLGEKDPPPIAVTPLRVEPRKARSHP